MDFGQWDKQEIDLKAFAQLSFKALRKGGTIICFYDFMENNKGPGGFYIGRLWHDKAHYMGKNQSRAS